MDNGIFVVLSVQSPREKFGVFVVSLRGYEGANYCAIGPKANKSCVNITAIGTLASRFPDPN
jgi:hypothetical protein